MTPTNAQGASPFEIGVLTTTSRQERSDLSAVETAVAGAQFSAIFDQATASKPQTPGHDEAPDDKTAETQSSSLVGPGLVLGGLVLLHLAGTQGASSNGQPAPTEQPEAPQTRSLGAAASPQIEAANASAIATPNNADAPKRMTLDALGTDFPAALAQAVSDNISVSKEPDVEAATTSDAPKRVMVSSSLTTHLPPVQAPVLPAQGAASGDAGSNNESGGSLPAQATEDPKEKGAAEETSSRQFVAAVDLSNPSIGASPSASSVADSFSPESVRTAASSAPRALTIDHPKDSPSKVLTIQLEPESLGAVIVRMQLSKTRVSLKMEVDSPTVQTMLSQSRDQLAEALSRAGHSVEEIAITVSPTPAPSTSFGDTRQNDSQAQYDPSREGGALNGNGDTGRNREDRSFSQPSKKGERPGDEHVPLGRARSAGAPGLYL